MSNTTTTQASDDDDEGVVVSIWEEPQPHGVVAQFFSIVRRIRDENGDVVSVSVFSENELEIVKNAIQLVEERLAARTRERRGLMH